MKEPKNYNNTQASTASTGGSLPAGLYVLRIMQVEETKSKKGKEMLKISFDIAEGEHKDYYANRYKSDTREDKKWSGVTYLLTEDDNGNTSTRFKGFNESVRQSNTGWTEVWGDKFCENYKNKLVGGVFGEEEYQKTDGSTAMSTKLRFWDSISNIKEGKIRIPDPKMLPVDKAPYGRPSPADAASAGFMQIPDGEEELPFN